MFLVLSPIKSLFQITQRCRTSRTFTTNIFNIVKKLLISATLVLKSYDKTYSKASESPYVHLAKGRCHDLANQLSHYLYFSYWTYNYKMEHGKVSHDFITMSQYCDGWSQMVMSQSQSVT